MEETITKVVGFVAAMLAFIQTAQAVPISGAISFTGDVTINSSSVATATEVTSWTSPSVGSVSGTFAAPSPSAVALNTSALFTSSIWKFTTFTPINNFWSVGGFTFELLSSYVFQQGGGSIIVDGTGIVSGNNYTPTTMFWSFTAKDPMAGYKPVGTFTVYSQSSSNPTTSVPDGGATAMLLGLTLSSLLGLKKKLAACVIRFG